VLFRIFDIFKPWPIKWIDQKISGGFGIMLDDVIAGLTAIPQIQIPTTEDNKVTILYIQRLV
jgi:phosphatidylglycerophosphatase A